MNKPTSDLKQVLEQSLREFNTRRLQLLTSLSLASLFDKDPFLFTFDLLRPAHEIIEDLVAQKLLKEEQCVIRSKATTDSGASRPLNPEYVDHRFRGMPSTF